MHYKTIVLELLQQHPEVHNQLRSNRTLLPTLVLYASQLKTNHEAWKDRLSQVMPGRTESEITSEALEIALKELKDFLDLSYPRDDSDPFSVEGAMTFILSLTRVA